MIKIREDIRQALEAGQPVVALESTIISHGMPYPENVETALEVERTVRENGAFPATIGIIKGEIKVGLSPEEIEYLGKTGLQAHKVSRRDLAYVTAKKLTGATTVAGTMIIARKAGIDVFATGGIGGVHRDASESFDISADLMELAHTRMIVVSAGVKSVLDIGATLEYLETMGVPVLGYQTEDFPAFYSRTSGFKVPFRVENAEEIARLYEQQVLLDLPQALLVACPVPEVFSIPKEEMETYINQALDKMKRLEISGKEVTPFLLNEIKKQTGGSSLTTNIALIQNNARMAAEIARSVHSLKRKVKN